MGYCDSKFFATRQSFSTMSSCDVVGNTNAFTIPELYYGKGKYVPNSSESSSEELIGSFNERKAAREQKEAAEADKCHGGQGEEEGDVLDQSLAGGSTSFATGSPRRLIGSSLCTDEDAPHGAGAFIFV